MNLQNKLNFVEKGLTDWNRTSFGNTGKELTRLNILLQETKALPPTKDNLHKVKQVQNQINEMLEREEIMWKQRSWISWLKEGDRNTKYFHRQASDRKKKNGIKGLKDGSRRWYTNQEDVGKIANKYL